MFRHTRIFAGYTLVVACVSMPAMAAPVSWINDSDGQWNVATNWSSNPATPGPADDVTINRPAANPIINHSGNIDTINSLSLSETLLMTGGNLNLTNASVVNASGNLSMQFGTVAIGAPGLTVNGRVEWAGGNPAVNGPGTLTVSASGNAAIIGGGQLNTVAQVNGPTLWTSGNLIFNNGTFNNAGTLTAQAPAGVFADNSGTNLFTNSGTVTSVPGPASTTEFRMPVTNSAIVNSNNGELFFTRPVTNTGTLSIAAGATMTFTNTSSFNVGTSFTGPGRVRFNGGTHTFSTPIDFNTRTVDLVSGTFTGPGNLTFRGPFNWTNGTVSGAGTVDITATGTMSLLNDLTMSRGFTNNGTIDWPNGNVFFTGGTLLNNSLMTARAPDRVLVENSGTNLFTNAGTLNVNPGEGHSIEFRMPATNTGTINVQSGTLFVTRQFTNNSTVSVPAGTDLQFFNGPTTHNAGINYSGTGFINFGSGTHTFNTPYNFGNRVVYLSATLMGSSDFTFPGRLEWFSGTISGAGNLNLPANSDLFVDGDITLQRIMNLSGDMLWFTGNIFMVNGTMNNNGSITVVSTGFVILENGGTNIFNNAGLYSSDPGNGFSNEIRLPLVHTGQINVISGELGITRTFTDSAPIDVPVGTELSLGGASTYNSGTSFTGGGNINFFANVHTFNTNINFGNRAVDLANATLTGAGNLTFPGSLTWTTGTISGAGLLSIPVGGNMKLSADKALQRNLQNAGTTTWTSGNIFLNSVTITNTGTFNANSNSVLLENGGTNSFVNSGSLIRNGGGSAELRLPITNTGLIDVQLNSLSMTRPVTQTAGEIRLSNANIVGNTTIGISGGSLTGNGQVTSSTLTNSAITAPGLAAAQAGRVAVLGNFTQAATSIYNVQIGGAAPVQYDRLAVTGNANINGTLNVSLINGHAPAANNEHQIVDGGVVNGTFATVNLPPIGAPLRWHLVYHPDEVVLRAILPGDANCDGVVNNADIPPFIMGLVNPNGYLTAQAPCDLDRLDMNNDGRSDGKDIQMFIDVLY